MARVAFFGLIVAGLPLQAVADDRPPRIALESYVGSRPSDADRVMATLRPVLQHNRFIVSPSALAKPFADHVWHAVGTKAAGASMSSGVDGGINMFHNADWSGAVTALKHAVDLGRANPIAWVNEPKYRDQMQQGVLYLALALSKQTTMERDAAADPREKDRDTHAKHADRLAADRDVVMADLIRMFPSFVVERKAFGLEAEQLFQRVRKAQDQLGRGSLELAVDDPNAVAYVDETIRPSHTTIGDLVPGHHHVLVVTRFDAREYAVEIKASQVARLSVEWDLDTVFQLSSDWAGFRYANAKDREHESAFIADLVGRNTGAIVAVTFTIARVDGHPDVTGVLYAATTGRAIRTCKITMTSVDDAKPLDTFVGCLLGATTAYLVSTVPPVSAGVAKPTSIRR